MTKTHRYIPMTEQDERDMLATIGAASIEELFRDIPEAVRYKGRLPISEALDEAALLRHMQEPGRPQRQPRSVCELPWRRHL